MPGYTIDFEPMGRRGQCQSTESILDCARRHRVGIASVCGGAGTCGKCRVRIVRGAVSRPTSRETRALSRQQLGGGWRLACQAYPLSDIRLEVAAESMTSPQRLQIEGIQATVKVNPPVRTARTGTPVLGMAIDVGTTKIAAYLVDLKDGRTLASRGAMNPQTSYGEDVITRIVAASDPGRAREMHQVVIDAVNKLAADLSAEAGASTESIVEAVAVGNTAMHHFLLGLPVKSLTLPPFAPAVSHEVDVKAREPGLHFAPGAYLHVLPNVAGFVGADHVAMLLATGALETEGPSLFVDIGTNTEVSLVFEGRITAASCASGPALEGGHIKDGMRAAKGAIERVLITEDSVHVQTIEDAPPAGICGSGIIDTLAQLHLAGIVDDGGRMRDGHPFVRCKGESREFVLVGGNSGNPAISFTQQDVRQTQLGKAAIRAGIQALLDNRGCPEEDIREVVIAGAFGSYIDVASAVEIGMLPPLPEERFRQVGNAAGMGAKLALVSRSERARARQVAERVEYLELGAAPGFSKTFTSALALGKYSLGKRGAGCR
ncbi:MAG: DUF4445 domain-containing protein [Chloroflexi bacterium]|nr:DUF4445 domain-containing protein [Chloroflexota bacterium]